MRLLGLLGSGQGTSESELDGQLPRPAEFGWANDSDQTEKGLGEKESL